MAIKHSPEKWDIPVWALSWVPCEAFSIFPAEVVPLWENNSEQKQKVLEELAYVLKPSLWACRELVLPALLIPAAAPHGQAAAVMELLWASDVSEWQRNWNSSIWAEDKCAHNEKVVFTTGDEKALSQLPSPPPSPSPPCTTCTQQWVTDVQFFWQKGVQEKLLLMLLPRKKKVTFST